MNHWRPDFLTLRLFVAVCEEASMTRAAERESLVPSAVSKRITELEEAVGVSLLVRGARGVRPTPAGVALLHHAKQIVRSTERMQVEIGEFRKGVRGYVRVLANISSINQFLPRDLSAFLAQEPHIRVDLQERVSPLIAEGVREGQADLGICLATVDLSELVVHRYAVDELAVVVHPAHPLARREVVSFEETLDQDFVALHPDSATTRRLVGLAATAGRTINHRMYVNTFEAAAHIVAENLAIGILARGAVESFRDRLGLHFVSLTNDWARREVVMVHRHAQLLSAPAQSLVAHLHARVGGRMAAS